MIQMGKRTATTIELRSLERRVDGNYLNILKRDAFQCAICGDDESFCVHHLDGDLKHNEMDNLLTVCRFCHAELHGFNSRLNTTNLKIITEMRENGGTYQKIGDFLGITRERVRQIIARHAVLNNKEISKIKSAEQGSLREEITCEWCGKKDTSAIGKRGRKLCEDCNRRKREGFSRYIICVGCGKHVDRIKEGIKFKQYCKKCHDIRWVEMKDPKVMFDCERCGKWFHPPYNWKSVKGTPKYCVMDCYYKRGFKCPIDKEGKEE